MSSLIRNNLNTLLVLHGFNRLDKKTLAKISKYKKRIVQLTNVESRYVTVPAKYQLAVVLDRSWMKGKSNLKCTPCRIEYELSESHIKKTKKELEKLERKVNNEIKTIVDFSNSIADKLKVNRSKFWNEIFA